MFFTNLTNSYKKKTQILAKAALIKRKETNWQYLLYETVTKSSIPWNTDLIVSQISPSYHMYL